MAFHPQNSGSTGPHSVLPEQRQRQPGTFIGMIGRIVSGCVALVLLLIGFLIGIYQGYFFVCGKWSENWPTVDGRIVGSRIETRSSSDGEPRYDAEVNYEFEVHGKKHFGDRIVFAFTSSRDQAEIESLLKPYPAGATVPVSFCALRPNLNCLRPGIQESGLGLFMLGFAGIQLLLGYGAAWLALRRRPYMEPIVTAASLPLAVQTTREVVESKPTSTSRWGSTTDQEIARNPERFCAEKGIAGGLIMMGAAILWFFGGLYCGIIYFYPPLLFVIGLTAFFKGMAEGNVNGNRRSYDAMTPWN